MNNVDQGNEIIEHITLKRKPFITKHVVHIPFTYRSSFANMKSQIKRYINCANLIKECTTSNSDIIAFKPNKVSTLMNKEKLDLVEGIVSASNAIFMRRVQYSNNTCLTRLIM
jgi:hypothetical protein